MINSLKLIFPFRSVSFQTQRFGNGNFYKTKHQEEFLVNCKKILLSKSLEIRKFLSGIGENDILIGNWCFLYNNFFTKKDGSISSHCPDLENGKKMIQDEIFKSFSLDDKMICLSYDLKWQGNDEIIFAIKSVKKEEFEIIKNKFIKNLLPDIF